MTGDSLAGLEPMARVIASCLATRPEYFVTHPSELQLFRSLDDEDLRRFAHRYGWRVIRRIGGRQIEFYNNAQTRSEATQHN